jgi:hypothetical protein
MERQEIIEMLAEFEANIMARLDAHQSRMDAIHKEMMAWLTDTNDNGEETVACQEKMEARLEEEKPASMEMKPEVAQEEVPREDTAVMPVRGLRKQRRGRKQAAGRREEPKKLN